MSSFLSVSSLLCSLLLLSCSPSANSPPSDEGTVERERVEVSGSISEDAVWESGKEYYVTGDVTEECGPAIQEYIRREREMELEG